MVTVGDLTESQILAQLVPLLPLGDDTILGSGDDCAVVRAPGGAFVVTTDVLVEGRHFLTDWSTGAQIGARAVAQNLSDVASMGARPTALVVSLVLPPTLPMEWLLDFARGMAAEATRAGAGIVGGDLVMADTIVVSVTAHGVYDGEPITRRGARPGDSVAVAGTLGRSAAGLAALTAGAVEPGWDGEEVPEEFSEAVAIFRAARPPYSAGPLAAQRGATSMMDVSDGLARDAGRLARASDVSIHLDSAGFAQDAAALRAAGEALGEDPEGWILFGGEDQSLLATFPPGVSIPEPFRVIGTVREPEVGASPHVVRYDGREVHGGWDHFHAADGHT